jgi:hypothetical protein
MDPTPRRGRRDNGLDAAAFVPLADVDPRIGEHLLVVLRAAGVPAYLEPSSDVEPYTRTVAIPSPPTDRLWVDREQRLAAGRIVAAEAQADGTDAAAAEIAGRAGAERRADMGVDERPSTGLNDLSEEELWRQIVASYETETATPVPPWPVSEDADLPAQRGGGDAPAGDSGRDAAPGGDPPAPAPPAAAVDDEEHYVPPPPPPVPRPARQTWLALVLIALGVLLMAAPGLIDMDFRSGMLFGGISVLSGAGVLVYRLRDSRDDDGPDDGAIV